MGYFGIKVVLLLLLLAGAIAYIGNLLGKSVGKKRLTLFSLRPRYTANFFTVVSGMLIALLTLSCLLFISKDAQTAFFGLEKLKQAIKEKSSLLNQTSAELIKIKVELEEKTKQRHIIQADLTLARQEITALLSTKEKLNKEIFKARQGTIFVKTGDVVASGLVEGGKAAIDNLNQFLRTAELNYQAFKPKKAAALIRVDPQNYAQTTEILKELPESCLVKLVSTSNVIFGEQIPVTIKIHKNTLVFQKGEKIALSTIDGKLSRDKIEGSIKNLLEKAHLSATQKGIQPDAQGSVGEISYAEIFELAKKIKLFNQLTEVTVTAAKDIYTFGPLSVEFNVKAK
jgi:uncharacterized protein (DUF3084 family)